MQSLILLDSDRNFTRAKQALVSLWNGRAELALHQFQVDEYKETKRRYQEKFYWGYVVTPFAESCGYTPEELHRVICITLYGSHTVLILGKEYEMPNKTTTTPKPMTIDEYDKHIIMASVMATEEDVFVQTYEAAV